MMNKCLKRSLGAGAFLLLAMVVAAGCYVFWPKQSIALPNGDRVKVEAVTWRPDNRFPTTSAAPLIGLLIKLFEVPRCFQWVEGRRWVSKGDDT
jgi:hypothetical protein